MKIRYILLIGFLFNIEAFATSFRQDLRACNRGDTTACERVGIRYIDGNGVRRNGYKALKYLSIACNRGSAGACNTMAFIYADGEAGVRQDYSKALKYWRRACWKGDRTACANIDLAKDKLRHHY